MQRNLVVTCDGTTNEVTGDITNVLRLFRCLARNEQQVAYYDCGVGTIANPDRIFDRGRTWSRKLDSALGLSVREQAVSAYRFLLRNYQLGDRIFLFGFSRGAYASRAVAGMIHQLGLLRPELEHLGELAWSVYSGENVDFTVSQRFEGGARFRKCFCLAETPRIDFVGVWDTVSSFGWFSDLKTLPHTANNPSIDHIRHAVAIDERRAMFRANHFRPRSTSQHKSVKEVWFAGSHGDVGGGYPEKIGTLSKVSLDWMLREATGCGLVVDPDSLEHITNDPPRHPPLDPLGPLHDESVKLRWWLPELLPTRRYSADAGKKRWNSSNLWRRRKVESTIPEQSKPVLHQSVVTRKMESGYDPPNFPDHYDIEE